MLINEKCSKEDYVKCGYLLQSWSKSIGCSTVFKNAGTDSILLQGEER